MMKHPPWNRICCRTYDRQLLLNVAVAQCGFLPEKGNTGLTELLIHSGST
jgi:hypothetical protein